MYRRVLAAIALGALALVTTREVRADEPAAASDGAARRAVLLPRVATGASPYERALRLLDGAELEAVTIAPVRAPPAPWPSPAATPLAPAREFAGRSFVIPAIESAATVGVTMVWNKYVGKASWANVSIASVERNLRHAWVLDDDQFQVNQLGHPYQGTFPYTAARSSGWGFWGSAAFVFASSAAWELVGETLPPAVNDQITTPVAGVALGEVMHRFAQEMRASGAAGTIAAALLEPFGEVNRHVLGTPPAEYRAGSRSSVALGMSLWSNLDEGTVRGAQPRIAFRHRTGLPADASLRLQRPFDVFDAEVAYGGGSGITVRARGLLAGQRLGDSAAFRGVWGAFLSYDDDDAPPAFRTSSSSLGLGLTAASALADGFTLEWTAVASAVLMGTAGTVRTPGFELRDYVMGPGAQGVLQLRLEGLDRFAADVQLRQTAIYGVAQTQGHELVLESRASMFVRVSGAHGLSAEYAEYRRIAHDPYAGALRARSDVVSLYYSYASAAWTRSVR